MIISYDYCAKESLPPRHRQPFLWLTPDLGAPFHADPVCVCVCVSLCVCVNRTITQAISITHALHVPVHYDTNKFTYTNPMINIDVTRTSIDSKSFLYAFGGYLIACEGKTQ